MAAESSEPLVGLARDSVCSVAGHRYDEAKQGHLTLMAAKRRALAADTPAIVDARLRSLDRRHCAPVQRALAAVVAEATTSGVVLRFGSGPGAYLARALETGTAADRLGVTLNLSAVAIRVAARIHPRPELSSET